MKKIPTLKTTVVQFLFSILFLNPGVIISQTAENPHRGLYVDKFVRFDNAGNYLPAFSILAVDTNHNGLFEKEDELLNYAQQNHFTSITLYNLQDVFDEDAPKQWNDSTKRFEELKEHLCRFIKKAKGQYKVDEVFAAVGSGEDADSIISLEEVFKKSTPKYEFSDAEKALPSYTARMQLITDQYPTNHRMFLISEIAKYILRVAHFEGCQNLIQFNGFSTELEFWNNSISTNNKDAANLDTLLRDIDTIKTNFITSHPGSPFTICVYYGRGATDNANLTCPNCAAEVIDGVASTHSTCVVTPDYCTGTTHRLADRIYFEKYLRNISQFSSQRKEVIFENVMTKDSTLIHPLFSAQSKINGSANDFFGDWILGGFGTSGSDNNQLRNIFQAEKFHYYDWQSYTSYNPESNIEKPGAFQWFSSSFLLKTFKNTPLFYADYNGCIGTPTLTFNYCGPREKNITYIFTVTASGGTLTLQSGTGSTSGETPKDTIGIADFLPDYTISGASATDSCTATLTLNFDNGTSLVSYTQVLKLDSGSITAIGFNSNHIQVCDGEVVLLRASKSNVNGSRYKWQSSPNGSTWTNISASDTIQFYSVTKSGYYRCLIKCGASIRTSNVIQVTLKENPYVLITNICGTRVLKADNSGLSNYNPGTLTYLWNNGSTADSIIVPTSGALSSYSVKVTNTINGCIAENTLRIPSTFPSTNNIRIAVDSISCTSGSGKARLSLITLTGNDVVKGIISDGVTTFYQTWTSGGFRKTITGLSPGKYHVAVNNNGRACSSDTNFVIGDTLTFVRDTAIHVTNASCKDSIDGKVRINVNTSGLSIVWATGILSTNTTIASSYLEVTGLKKGTYYLKIYNSSCQFQYVRFTIGEPSGFSLIPTVTDVHCDGGTTGSIVQVITGIGYTYSWSSGQTTKDISSLSSGVYVCTITASGGCKESFTYFVDQSHPIALLQKRITPVCNLPFNGRDTFLIYGGIPIDTGAASYTITSVPPATWNLVTGKKFEFVGANLKDTIYTLTVHDKYCTKQITITIPSNRPNAGPDQNICSTTTSLAAVVPYQGTGAWTKIAGGGTITNSSLATSSVTGLTIGLNKFVWTLSGNPCSPNSDTVTVTLDTVAYAGPDQHLCASSSTNLSARIPVVGTGLWTKIAGFGTIVTPGAYNSSVIGLHKGTNTFVWTITSGVCTKNIDTVSVIVDSLANAGSDQTICSSSSLNLAGGSIVAGTGAWSVATGTGTFASINSPTSSVTGFSIGANKYVWTISGGYCSTSTDTVQINVDAAITASAGPDQHICGTIAMLEGNNPSPGSGLWTKPSGFGTITSNTVYNTGLTALSGTTSFVWSISNGVCAVSRDTMVIYSTGYPELPATSPASSTKYSVSNDYTLGSSIILKGDTIFVAPGKKILVPTNTTPYVLTIDSNTVIKECTKMWVGVVVDSTAKLIMTRNSKIEGAQYGINFLNGSNYQMNTAIFNRNYVGINFNGYTHTVYGTDTYNKLKFDCSKANGSQDTLPAAYSGQTPAIGVKGFAGMLLQSSAVNFSAYTIDSLNFNHLSNGIICNNTFLTIEKSVFTNIHADGSYDGYNPQHINGTGVLANNFITGAATIRGFDFLSGIAIPDSLKANFRNCDTAIVVLGRGATIYNNHTENVAVGIRTTTSSGGIFTAYSNKLRVKNIGIDLLHSDNANTISINYNKIMVGENSSGPAGNKGINVNMMNNTSSPTVSISYNLIDLYAAEAGIAFTNLRNGMAKGDTINILRTDNGIICRGISVNGCKKLQLEANDIIGTDTADVLQQGIYISGSDTSKLFCNYTDDTYEGILANGISENCDIRSNTMHDHAKGFHLNSGSRIGLHYWKGNLWDGNYSRIGAVYDNATSPQLAASLFKVKDVTLANHLIPPTIDPPSTWFISDVTTNDFKCSDFKHGGGGGFGDPGDDDPIEEEEFSQRISPEDSAAAEGDEIQFELYSEEGNYILDQKLYHKLAKSPEFLENSLMNDFYLRNENAAIGVLENVLNSHFEILSGKTLDEIILDSLHNELEEKISQLTASANENDVRQYSSEAFLLQREIEEKANLVRLEKIASIEDVIDVNTNVNDEENIESYEKIVNDIYLNTVAKNIYEFTEGQKQSLYNIANVCPLEGGKAVYSARSIYALIDDRQYYDDSYLCTPSEALRKGISDKTKESKSNLYLLFDVSPNPASESLEIQYKVKENDEICFSIFNAFSQKITSSKLNPNDGKQKVDVSGLMNGVYFIKAFSGDKQIGLKKIIIIH